MRYLNLRRLAQPPPKARDGGALRVYADEDGVLHTINSEGTDAPFAEPGTLPSTAGKSEGDVLALDSELEADWAAPSGGSQTLAEVLAAGSDGDGGGMTNTGVITTGGGDVSAEGGDISSGGGLITSGGGNVESSGGDFDSNGGDLLVGAGALRFGSAFRINSDATIAGTSGAAFLGNVAAVAAGGTKPEVPASPTEQDIVDALVALGLVTQAS